MKGDYQMIMTFEQTVDAVMQLTLEQQDLLADLLKRWRLEQTRTQIAKAAAEDIADFHRGKFQSQPVADIIAELRQTLVD